MLVAALVAASVVPATAVARGRHYSVQSTAYSPCSSGTIMANGQHTHWGAVANNFLPLGTRIRMDHRVRGRRWFTVEDRIGHGSQLDIFMPSCAAAIQWGRRQIGFTVRQ